MELVGLHLRRSADCLYERHLAPRTELCPVIHAFLVMVRGEGGPDAGADQGQCGDQEADGGPGALNEHGTTPVSPATKLVRSQDGGYERPVSPTCRDDELSYRLYRDTRTARTVQSGSDQKER